MKQRIKFALTALLFVSSAIALGLSITLPIPLITAAASTAQGCVPQWYPTGDSQQPCPGLYKRANYMVATTYGSQGSIMTPMITTADGGCGYQLTCAGTFLGWYNAWPGFHPVNAYSGCWSQNVTAYSAKCVSVASNSRSSREKSSFYTQE